jgi:hypothetical protein
MAERGNVMQIGPGRLGIVGSMFLGYSVGSTLLGGAAHTVTVAGAAGRAARADSDAGPFTFRGDPLDPAGEVLALLGRPTWAACFDVRTQRGAGAFIETTSWPQYQCPRPLLPLDCQEDLLRFAFMYEIGPWCSGKILAMLAPLHSEEHATIADTYTVLRTAPAWWTPRHDAAFALWYSALETRLLNYCQAAGAAVDPDRF